MSTESARVWTAEKLARAWPVDGWTWSKGPYGEWSLFSDSGEEVYVDADGRVRSDECEPVHGSVAAAVWGAHQGRDSAESIAKHIDGVAAEFSRAAQGWAAGELSAVAAMLRAGRVPT